MYTRRGVIRTTGLVMLLGLLSKASAAPNFSGNWKMNATRSSFAPLPAPDTMTRRITHQGQHLKIVTNQSGQQREIITELSYTTDGRPCKNMIRGQEVTGTAQWDSDKLVIESAREVQGTRIDQRETWSLSEDGHTLTIANRVQTPQGAFDITIVLEK